jgi:DNA-binding beta-propeller fold protein YncE
VIDVRRLRKVGSINVIPDGDMPHEPEQIALYPTVVALQGVNYAQDLTVSPNGRVLYVARGFIGDVAAFRIKTGEMLWRVPIGGLRADHLALTENGRRLFVSALTEHEVEVVDTNKRAVVGSFPAGDWAHGLHFSSDGERIYNGSMGDGLLPDDADGGRHVMTIADARALEVLETIPFEEGVRPFVVTPNEKRLYVQLSYLHGFVVYDLESDRIARTVNLPISKEAAQLDREDYPNEAAHHGIELSHDRRFLCIAGTLSDYAALVRRPGLRLAVRIPVDDEPGDVAQSPNGRHCYLANRGPDANTVSVISYAKRKEVKRIPVGDHPQHLHEDRIPAKIVRSVRKR